MPAQSSPEDRIVEHLYDGVLRPEAWNEALNALCKLAACEHAALTSWDRATNLGGVHESVGLPADCRRQFVDHYCALDPARDRMDDFQIGDWYVDHVHVGTQAMRRSAFYQDFLRHFDLGSIAATPLERDGCGESFLVFQYDLQYARRCQMPSSALSRVVPHIRRALQLRRRFTVLETENSLRSTVFNQLRLPLMVVDAGGRILMANAGAEAALARHASLRVTYGRLAVSGRDSARWAALLAAACTAAPRVAGGMRLQSGTGPDVTQILMTPLPPGWSPSNQESGPLALILLQDQQRPHEVPAALLQQLYSLTPSELRVARGISRGEAPRDTAQRLGVSIATVRTQLSAVFQKTGTSRQPELVQLLGTFAVLGAH